jgi:hypothetical protein
VDAQVPADGRVQIRLRAADTRDALGSARWLGPWDAQRIDLLDVAELGEERYLEVEARLVSGDRRRSPTLRQVTVQLHCPI